MFQHALMVTPLHLQLRPQHQLAIAAMMDSSHRNSRLGLRSQHLEQASAFVVAA